jgi:hypothetical protein
MRIGVEAGELADNHKVVHLRGKTDIRLTNYVVKQ